MRTLLAICLLTVTAHAEIITFKVGEIAPEACQERRAYGCAPGDYHFEYDTQADEVSLISWAKEGRFDFEPATWSMGPYPGHEGTPDTWRQANIEMTDNITGITDTRRLNLFYGFYGRDRPRTYAMGLNRVLTGLGPHPPTFYPGGHVNFYQAIPEPSGFMLALCGIVLLCGRNR